MSSVIASRIIACRNLLSDRRLCGAAALVHRAEFKYAPGDDLTKRILLEMTYDIECPRCGRRTQIEPVR